MFKLNDPFLTALFTFAQAKLKRLLDLRNDDRGGLSIEAMIIVGSLVAIAAIATATLLVKVNEKKDEIK